MQGAGQVQEHEEEMLLPKEIANYFSIAVDEVLTLYSLLANAAGIKPAFLLWNLAPKHNYSYYVCQKAEFLNPRKRNCFC